MKLDTGMAWASAGVAVSSMASISSEQSRSARKGGNTSFFFSSSPRILSLPGEEMQQKYKCRVETAVGHCARPGHSTIHNMDQIWEAILTVDTGANTAASAVCQVRGPRACSPPRPTGRCDLCVRPASAQGGISSGRSKAVGSRLPSEQVP